MITVFLENSGGGGDKAAPVAVAIINAINNKNIHAFKEKEKIYDYIEKIYYDK